MIVLISLAMIIDRIIAGRGIVYFAKMGMLIEKQKPWTRKKHEEIGIKPNSENWTDKLKEEAHCIQIQGRPDSKCWATVYGVKDDMPFVDFANISAKII